ncbi:hypothetical protein CEXT_173061 [Caerostris extrusa]|uniref:Uncharacterized protein n=1 Tax=Caerostris extrusa TaxID=172846 RepID=A0AAV4ULM1_CAEEX|nr:hypothetical protein CEXT_173061 [Caerostris extrusa]
MEFSLKFTIELGKYESKLIRQGTSILGRRLTIDFRACHHHMWRSEMTCFPTSSGRKLMSIIHCGSSTDPTFDLLVEFQKRTDSMDWDSTSIKFSVVQFYFSAVEGMK